MHIPMARVLAHYAQSDAGATAIACGDDTISYAGLDRRSTALAHDYLERGVTPGSIVAILLPNGIEFFVATFATWKLGATPMPLSYRLPEIEREDMLELAQPTLVVGLDASSIGVWTRIPADFHPTGGADAPLPRVEPRQPWKAIGSGGSTGRPKLIVAGRPAVVDLAQPQYTILPGDIVLVPGPMYHQGPFIFSTGGLFIGGKIVIMPHFDAEETLALIERHRVTWTYFVPTMTHRIWRLDEDVRNRFDLSSLRIVMSTGAPWAPWLKEEWIRWLGPEKILEGYGGTEEQGGLLITGLEALAHPGSVGKAHDDLRVLDDDGNEVAAGTLGELYFRAPADEQHRYIGADNHDRDGWRSYGDLGHIGEDGYAYLSDRRTDMIISGGANIYPAEVEGALEAHPAVRSAVVIGLPDDDLGQRAHAIVDVAEDHSVSDDDLRSHLRQRTASFKIPRTFEFVHHPLRDDAGKVRRAALRGQRLVTTPAIQKQS